jgi:hypothetical protein
MRSKLDNPVLTQNPARLAILKFILELPCAICAWRLELSRSEQTGIGKLTRSGRDNPAPDSQETALLHSLNALILRSR